MANTYFISDLHLGLNVNSPRERERKVVRFLESIRHRADALYLLGDIFDFWWEYKTVVPRGFVRFIGALASLSDAGVPIYYFTGNHDIWVKNYFEQECGVRMFRTGQLVQLGSKKFYLEHGDQIDITGGRDRLLQRLFRSSTLQRVYSMLHPRWGVGLGLAWSHRSRMSKGLALPWQGKQEPMYRVAQQMLQQQEIDYFVFGHRHTPLLIPLDKGAQLAVLSDWIGGSTYAVFDGEQLRLQQFEEA